MIYLYIASTVIFIWVIFKMHRRIADLETEYNTLKAEANTVMPNINKLKTDIAIRIADLETQYNTLKAETDKAVNECNNEITSRIDTLQKVTRTHLLKINDRLNKIESTLQADHPRLPDAAPIEPDEVITEEPPEEKPNPTAEELLGKMVITGVSKLLKSIL